RLLWPFFPRSSYWCESVVLSIFRPMNRRLVAALVLLLALGATLAVWRRSRPDSAGAPRAHVQPSAVTARPETVATAKVSPTPPAPAPSRVPPALASELAQLL